MGWSTLDKYDVTIPTVPSPTVTAWTSPAAPIASGFTTLQNSVIFDTSTSTSTTLNWTLLGPEEIKAMVKEAVAEMFAEMLGKSE